jgi:hypothetical protein
VLLGVIVNSSVHSKSAEPWAQETRSHVHGVDERRSTVLCCITADILVYHPLQYQQCFMDEATGDVVVIYHETTIVRVGNSDGLSFCIPGYAPAVLCVRLQCPGRVQQVQGSRIRNRELYGCLMCCCRSRRRETSRSTRGASTRCAAAASCIAPASRVLGEVRGCSHTGRLCSL